MRLAWTAVPAADGLYPVRKSSGGLLAVESEPIPFVSLDPPHGDAVRTLRSARRERLRWQRSCALWSLAPALQRARARAARHDREPGATAAQHRVRPHGRPLDGSPPVHAARPGDGTARVHLPGLLRLRLALLPLTSVDLHRALPAQHARPR